LHRRLQCRFGERCSTLNINGESTAQIVLAFGQNVAAIQQTTQQEESALQVDVGEHPDKIMAVTE